MQWTPDNAGKVFEDQILVNPDIDLVFAHSGHLTVPIVSIMESKGKKPGDIFMLASSGMPVALDHIRQGWQQAEVEQPTFAQVYGIAMFLPMILKGEKPQPGTYKVLGLDAVLTDEAWGPNLKIPGATIVKENVDNPRFWGNMKVPTDPVEPVP
jgi:ribose transport system substrate-binding protein